MREKLLALYTTKQQAFKKVLEQFVADDLHGPFLMSPNNIFDKQKSPLLIIGQETYGWGKNVDDLSKQMEDYEIFNVGVDYYSSPFWNITRKVELAIGNEHHSCAWTNVSKYDVGGGRAQGEHKTAISILDNILIDEIKIIQPKVCLFFTGPAFDERIKNIFSNIEFQQTTDWATRQLCQFKHPSLPRLSFRTYHPNYLRRSGLEHRFIDFITNLSVSVNKLS